MGRPALSLAVSLLVLTFSRPDDRVVHANFLRPSRVFEVSVIPIDREESDEMDVWDPYPISQRGRASWLSQYFDEACRLSVIARDISRGLEAHSEPDPDPRSHKRALYDRLRRWEEELPSEFAPAQKPAPHILLLRCEPSLYPALSARVG